MSKRWKVKNLELCGRTVTMRGGAVIIDSRGFLPVDLTPEQLEHARHSGLFDAVTVTRASVIHDELAAGRGRLEELERSADQAYKVFRQWSDQHDAARDAVRALEDELEGLGGVQAPEPVDRAPAAPIDLDEVDWERLKSLAREHDVPIARRSKDEIKADLAGVFLAGADQKPLLFVEAPADEPTTTEKDG